MASGEPGSKREAPGPMTKSCSAWIGIMIPTIVSFHASACPYGDLQKPSSPRIDQ
jgi:hypothetical protein